jgi:hypothetical protein
MFAYLHFGFTYFFKYRILALVDKILAVREKNWPENVPKSSKLGGKCGLSLMRTSGFD